jgi:hypothetical protein
MTLLLLTMKLFTLTLVWISLVTAAHAQQLPTALKDWTDWVTWEDHHTQGPVLYHDAKTHIAVWPSVLDIKATEQGAAFTLKAKVYKGGEFFLPGDTDCWPQRVQVNDTVATVLSRNGLPCLELKPSTSNEVTLTGKFEWKEMPQRVQIPPNIGLLELTLKGQKVDLPVWDQGGMLWLQRASKETTDKDFLSKQVYRLIEDGSPQWLRTLVELSVSGKSREEVLGHVLPEGWQLCSVDGPIPCAVDDTGLMKAQVRPGKWLVNLTAYRTTPVTTMCYAEGKKPMTEDELVGLQNLPGFRVIEITGLTAVDVTQTTYPEQWRQFPLYLWPSNQSFQIQENMRGMGMKKPPGIQIKRQFWLDEDGQTFTYQDDITGSGQQTWRLDVAEGLQLGAVKSAGTGQLITKNPLTGMQGIEIRARNLELQAVGRMPKQSKLSAVGWKSDAESVNTELNLPPGWRLLAVLGADWSHGDWLTAWSLYDVFLLLIFSLALTRMYGFLTGLVAFVGFIISYHEIGAPRYAWLLVVIALAAVQYVKSGALAGWLIRFQWVAVGLLVLNALPYVVQQIQQAIYPQLEPHRYTHRAYNKYDDTDPFSAEALPTARTSYDAIDSRPRNTEDLKYSDASKKEKLFNSKQNLLYDNKAKIQTGPAIPQWQWREAAYGWNGPVAAGEQVKLLLIPGGIQRLLCLLRVISLLALLALLLRKRATTPPTSSAPHEKPDTASQLSASAATIMAFLCIGLGSVAQAQTPSPELLNQLKERLQEQVANLPSLAEIPQVALKLQERVLKMEAEIHTFQDVAVPLPGMLPSWSPVEVTVDGTAATVARKDGYLWVALPTGTHRVQTEGLLAPGAEWQWSFLLRPRQVIIDAPGWTVTGVKPTGVPEDQVFFVQQNQTVSTEAAYDRKDFNPVLRVEREIELGLIWQVRTKVTRLSPTGKAISMSLPLLPQERVLSANANINDNRLQVALGAQEECVEWDSEMTMQASLSLEAEKSSQWVERWKLTTSPVWNLQTSGLAPVFEMSDTELLPVWTPWPGEKVELKISRPEPVQGETTTVRKVTQKTNIGERQRSTSLVLDVQASLGDDFTLELPSNAEITKLAVRGQETPVRKDGAKLIIPLRPGDQKLELNWKTPEALRLKSTTDSIKLPVQAANISTSINMPASRWLLWASGPLRGPAVRFWGLTFATILFSLILSKLPYSPLSFLQWTLLLLGFLQLPLFIGAGVAAWFFLIAWRGKAGHTALPSIIFRLLQLALIFGAGLVLIFMLSVVHQGLLGRPEMFVSGMNSTTSQLNWFLDHTRENALPQPLVYSVSIWWYRIFMLFWALWLARSILLWIPWAYQQLLAGSFWKSRLQKTEDLPPPLP